MACPRCGGPMKVVTGGTQCMIRGCKFIARWTSQDGVQCPVCDGSRVVACRHCDGRGAKVISALMAAVGVCAYCNGTGSAACELCKASGKISAAAAGEFKKSRRAARLAQFPVLLGKLLINAAIFLCVGLLLVSIFFFIQGAYVPALIVFLVCLLGGYFVARPRRG